MHWNVIAKNKMPGTPTIPGYKKRCWITEWPVLFPHLLVDGRHTTKEILYLAASYSPNDEECKKNPHDVVYKFVFKYAVYESDSEHGTPFYSKAPEKLDQKFIDVDVLQKVLMENNGAVDLSKDASFGRISFGKIRVLSVDIGMYDGLPVLNVHVDRSFGEMDAFTMSVYDSPLGRIMAHFPRELGMMSMFPNQLPDFDATTKALSAMDDYHFAMNHEDCNYYDRQRQEYRKGLEDDMAGLQDMENEFVEVSQKAADAMNKLSEQYGIDLTAEKQDADDYFSRAYGVSRPRLKGYVSNSFFSASLGWDIKGCSTRFVLNVYKSRQGTFMFEICEYTDKGFARPLDPKWLRGFVSTASEFIKDSRLPEFKLVEIGGRLYFKGEYDTERILPHTPPGEDFAYLTGLRGFMGPEWCGGIGDHLATAHIFNDRIQDFMTSWSVFKLMEDIVSFLNEVDYHDRRVGNAQNGVEHDKDALAELDKSQREEIESKNAALEYLKGIGVFT